MTNGFKAADILSTLPPVLAGDKTMQSIAQVTAGALYQLSEEKSDAIIYAAIDSLPEKLLDILAYDFKVDWWDSNYTMAEKRQILKDSWGVHRSLGTKAAVETAMSAIYADTKVLEWFEYGADPYHYKLLVDATYQDVDPAKHRRVLDRVIYYQNLRSHLDGVEYIAVPDGYCRSYGVAAAAGMSLEITVEVAVYGLE